MARRHIIMRRILMCAMVSVASWAVSSATAAAQDPAPRGDDPYAFYTIPGECVQAARRVEQRVWRGRRSDTVYQAPAGNPFTADAREAAAACVAHFSLAAVAERDLMGLGEAYLAAGQDAQADSAFARMLALAASHPRDDRAWRLTWIVNAYVNARPSRIDAAQRYAAVLDTMTNSVAVQRAMVHQAILARAMIMDSLPLVTRELARASAASDALSGDPLHEWVMLPVQTALNGAQLAVRMDQPDSAGHILERAQRTLEPVNRGAAATLGRTAQSLGVYRVPAPPIAAEFWFNTGDARPVRPASGHISLLIFVDADCGATCFPAYATLRRLAQRYQPTGLDVTLVAQTNGFYHEQLVPKPADEASLLRGFFLDTLALPGALAVSATNFGRRDDGHRTVDARPNLEQYAIGAIPQAVVVDARGRVRLVTDIGPGTEAALAAVIDSLL
jgi:hypothetical protein